MWKKTAILQLGKYLPMSQELTRAVAYDEATEGGIEIEADFSIEEGPSYDIEPQSLELLNKMFDDLSINQAERSMELAKASGNKKATDDLIRTARFELALTA